MSCCKCSNTLDLCKQPVCTGGVLTTPFKAPMDGDYTLVTEFQGNTLRSTQTFTNGAELVFDIKHLNEYSCYTAQIIDKDGNVIKYTDSLGIEFDCLRFETNLRHDRTIPAT